MVNKYALTEKIVASYLYDGVKFTTDELSKELGISKRTLYEVFGSKDELLRTCAMHIMSNVFQKSTEINAKTSMRSLLMYLLPIHKSENLIYLSKYNKFFADLQKKYSDIYKEVIEMHNEQMYEILKNALCVGIEIGAIRPEIKLELFIDIINYQQKSMDDITLKYFAKDILNTCIFASLRGICTPKGVELLDNIILEYEADMIKNIENKIINKGK